MPVHRRSKAWGIEDMSADVRSLVPTLAYVLDLAGMETNAWTVIANQAGSLYESDASTEEVEETKTKLAMRDWEVGDLCEGGDEGACVSCGGRPSGTWGGEDVGRRPCVGEVHPELEERFWHSRDCTQVSPGDSATDTGGRGCQPIYTSVPDVRYYI